MRHVHTIPADPSLTSGHPWYGWRFFGCRVTVTGPETWANVDREGECDA